MLKAELLAIIANSENSGVEFKRDDIRPEQLAKEVVAMANFQGGMVLLGVEDDGEISGIQREDLEEWVMNVFQSKIHPMILPFYEEVQIDAEKRVAIVSFPMGISKPYVVRHAGKEDIYIRTGSRSSVASREQQMRLFELDGLLHPETLPVPQTNIDSLDKARLLNYIQNILQDPDVPQTQEQWQNRLLGLGLLTEVEATSKVCCTLAGLVLFGKQPRRYLKQAGLRLMVFDSQDKEYQALIDEVLDGPLVGRWDVTSTDKQLLDAGVIERFDALIKPHLAQEADTLTQGLRKDTQWFYPLEAVREVVVNALAHRDWTRFIEVEVTAYSNRLEVISPGAMSNSMTIEKMKAGQRSPRNIIIMEVLRDYGYVDSRGMVIRTKVMPLMVEYTGQEPEFELTEDYLKTVLWK